MSAGRNKNATPARKPAPPSEHSSQAAVIYWWSLAHKKAGVADERLLFAIPNAGKRSRAAGGRLKREGMRKGVVDLLLAVARAPWHGLFIEMKRRGEKPTPEQTTFMASAREQGYQTKVAYDASEACAVIAGYLGKPHTGAFA